LVAVNTAFHTKVRKAQSPFQDQALSGVGLIDTEPLEFRSNNPGKCVT